MLFLRRRFAWVECRIFECCGVVVGPGLAVLVRLDLHLVFALGVFVGERSAGGLEMPSTSECCEAIDAATADHRDGHREHSVAQRPSEHRPIRPHQRAHHRIGFLGPDLPADEEAAQHRDERHGEDGGPGHREGLRERQGVEQLALLAGEGCPSLQSIVHSRHDNCVLEWECTMSTEIRSPDYEWLLTAMQLSGQRILLCRARPS